MEETGGTGLNRQNARDLLARGSSYDAVIHCAFTPAKGLTSADLPAYYADNLKLTEELLRIPCGKFIYLSSIDVYPVDKTLHAEDEIIPLGLPGSPYPFTKLLAEALVKSSSASHLILRPGLMLGKYMRANNLYRLLHEDPAELTLSADSAFYLVRHEDVLEFIQCALRHDLTGIFNVVPSTSLTLGAIQEKYHRNARFGEHYYYSRAVANDKIRRICPLFGKTSEKVLAEFLKAAA